MANLIKTRQMQSELRNFVPGVAPRGAVGLARRQYGRQAVPPSVGG